MIIHNNPANLIGHVLQKLQADRRPVSRVIYECLSLIEKKDMKLSIVFEYIFQECYLKLYPGLQEILQGSFFTYVFYLFFN